MYLNIKVFEDEGLEPQDLYILSLIKQNKAGNEETVEKLSKVDEADFKRLEALSLISYRKLSKKEDTLAKRAKLTTTGSSVMLSLVTSSFGSDEEKIIDWIIGVYKARGGFVTNRKESLRRMKWFSDITGLKENDLALLIRSYMANTFQHEGKENYFEAFKEYKRLNPKAVLSQKVDNLFYKPEGLYDVKPSSYTLDKSPLYEFWKING